MRIILLITSLILSLSAQSQNNNESILPNALRVKFSSNIDLPASTNSFHTSQGDLSIGNQAVDQLNSQYHASKMERVFPYAGKFETKHQKYGLHLWYDIYVEPGTSIEELTSQYSNLSEITIAESIKVYKHEDFQGEELNSNDPRLQDQWHYENKGQTEGTVGSDISLLQAWEQETGDSRVVVSVHDSGIDIDHPDLNDHLWINKGEIPNDNIDNDNNGFVDDYYGYNFAAAVVGGDPSDVNDYGGHGTHTSGTIAAESNNGVGVSGVAGGSGSGDGVRIMMMRLGDDDGSPYIYNPAPSFIYAADMGAVISSNSWGGGSYDQSVVDAINYFTAEAGSDALKGGLVLFSSGNSDNISPDYKSDLDHLMMVSASNHNDQKAWYSNYGTWVDITAPGGETSIQIRGVLSTLPNNSYGFYQGTSMACPHVSGVAALLASKAYGTGLTNTQLESALLTTTDPIDNLNPNYIGMLGSGRLNALAALEAVAQGSGSNGELLIDPINIVTEINEGESETYTIKVVNTQNFDVEVEVETSDEWINVNAVNFALAPNAVFKFSAEINSSIAGNLQQGEIKFNYLSFNSNTTAVLPIQVYTLGDAEISTIDTLNFGLQYIGYEVQQQLEIHNTGSNYLAITGISNWNQDYSFDFSDTIIAPSSSYLLPINFTPSQGGVIIDSLQIVTNDPNQGDFKMMLKGNGNTLNPPEPLLNPESIYIEQLSATNGYSSFQITNQGDEALEYNIGRNPAEIVPLENYSSSNKELTIDSNPAQDNGSSSGLGNLISHQENPIKSETGMAHDGDNLWIKHSNSSKIFKYDTENHLAVDSISSIAESSSGLDFYNGFIWENDLNNQINQYDLEGNVVNHIDLPNISFRNGIAVDNEGVWLISNNQFIVLDFNGEVLQQYTNYYINNVESFETLGTNIYTISNGFLQVIHKGDLYRNNTSSYIGGHYLINTEGLAFDGENAWVSFTDYDVLVEFKLFSNFLSYHYPRNGTLASGQTQNISFEYYLYNHDGGFVYTDLFQITSNSLERPKINLPVTINITGTPQIVLSTTQISFDAYLGNETIDTLTITNNGSAPLILSDISSSIADFQFDFSETVLDRNETLDLPISITMTTTDTLNAVLQINSNDLNQSLININLKAIGRLAPEISVSPSSLSIELYEQQVDSVPLTVTNSGAGKLFYYTMNEPDTNNKGNIVNKSENFSGGKILASKNETVENSNYFSSPSYPINAVNSSINFAGLEEIQANMDENIIGLTSILPSLYNFYDGISGTLISDGGGDMYDGGNRLSTNLGTSILYTNSSIDESSSYFGGGAYFTSKYEGLFTLSADMIGVTNFTISGNLGADGSGSVDGSVLFFNYRGVEWLGFVKRVYNAGDPSVNHLIIVPNNGSVSHSFATHTDDDYHSIDNLADITRLHYLLFAGQNGYYYDDNTILNLMEAYLTSIENQGFESFIDPNSSEETHIVFDTKNLNPNTYEYNVEIHSNDPIKSSVDVPTSLVVNSRSVFTQNQGSILYDTSFVGGTSTIEIVITNTGSENLILRDFNLDGDAEIFLEENLPDTLLPGLSESLITMFSPSIIGNVSSILSFQTNDPLKESVNIQLNGHGAASTILTLDPKLTSDTLTIGETNNYAVSVTNEGTEPLDYRVVLNQTVPFNLLIEEIESIQAQSSLLNGLADDTRADSQVSQDAEQIADYRISSGGKNILILGAESSWNSLIGIFNELDASGDFGFIGYVNTYYSNLNSINLDYYEAILVWNKDGHSSANELGNKLADYVDQGGGVVTAIFENTNSSIGGRWQTESAKYTLYNSQDFGVQFGYDYAFVTADQNENHPLLTNVNTLEAGYYGLRTLASSEHVSTDAEIVATWNDGTPAIIASTLDAVKRVDLGFYPGSNNVMYQSWDSSSDGTQIIANALEYVSGGIAGSEASWIEASTYRVEDQLVGENKEITFTVNADDLNEGNVAARASFYSNDSRAITQYSYFDISIDGTSLLEISDSLNFEDVTLGFAKTMSIPLINRGNGSAEIVITIDSLSNFKLPSYPADTFKLNAFSKVDIEIDLEAVTLGRIVDKLSIENLSDNSIYEVILTADIQSPGSIRIEPSEIELLVDYQSEISSSFTIYNDGKGALDFIMPTFRNKQVSQNANSNNTQRIEFSTTPNKGETDNRTGHPILFGNGFDNFGYSYMDSSEPESPNYSWNDISDSGTPITLSDDDSKKIEIDFEFPFYDFRMSSLFIGSNGVLSFQEEGVTNPINQQIPFNSAPNSIICPFWKDLSPNDGGTIYYEMNAEKCVVQFTNIPDYGGTGTFSFQAIIYPSGDITFLYHSMNGSVNDATIGIEDDLGSNGMQIAFNTNYVSNNFGVYITYPQPYISPEITYGSILSGDSLEIPFIYSSLDKIGGVHRHELAITSNDTLNTNSILGINAEVVAESIISLYNDTLRLDTTYINRVSSKPFWFYNEGIGVLEIDQVNSMNTNFNALFPEYQAKIGADTLSYYVDLDVNPNTGRVKGEVYGLIGELVSAEVYRKENGDRKVIASLSATSSGSGKYLINETFPITPQEQWFLAENELYIDFYTTENPSGSGEINIVSKVQTVFSKEYTYGFLALYRPQSAVPDSTTFNIVSNAINTDELSLVAFGVGQSSLANININITSIEESLSVGDSVVRTFAVSNTGSDSLHVNLAIGDYNFESNKNSISFSESRTLPSIKKENYNEWLAPENAVITKAISSEKVNSNFALRPYYGTGYHASGSDFSIIDPFNNISVTPLIDVSSYDFTMASEFLPGSANQLLNLSYTGELYTTDLTDQEHQYIGNILGDSDWTGLCSTPDPNVFYANTLTSLYTLNLRTLNAELVGNFTVNRMIGIAIDGVGSLYGYDLNTDQLYSINKFNGAATSIGNIGFNAEFGQDLGYDQETDQIIMSAYSSANGSELRIVNKIDGSTQSIGNIGTNLSDFQGASIAFQNSSSSFISLDTYNYSLAPGQLAEVSVHLNSTNLNNGNHTAYINVSSNDFSNPAISIPIALNVTGNNPTVGTFTEAINFGLQTVKSVTTENVSIENAGKEVLEIILIEAHLPYLSDYNINDTVKIDIGGSFEFDISFYPEDAGVFNHFMTWSTNDPSTPEISIKLSGASERDSKHIELSYFEFSTQASRNDSKDATLEVFNLGEDSVKISISELIQTDWLIMDSTYSIIAPNSSMDIPISINSIDLNIGYFDTQLILVSNDPMYDSLIIPISLEVLNQDIELISEIPSQLLAINEDDLQLTLSDYFSDNDGDSLIYTISSNGFTTVNHDGKILTLSTSLYGPDTISIDVSDQVGGIIHTSFEVMNNGRPNSTEVASISRRIGNSLSEIVDLNNHFSDPDGDQLSFEITSSDPIAELYVDGNNKVIMSSLAEGDTEVTITAFDGYHEKSESFNLLIEPASKHLEIEFVEYNTQLFRGESVDVNLQVSSIGEEAVNFSISKDEKSVWLELDSMNVLIPSKNSINVPISINSHDLNIGSFDTQLLIVSDDPMYDSLIISISLEVLNQDIELISEIPSQLMAINEDELQLTLSDYFSDNDGDSLIYTISSNGFTTVNHDGKILTLSTSSYGLDTISIDVSDQVGGIIHTSFEARVNSRPSSSTIDNVSKRLDEPLIEIIDLNSHFSDSDENELIFEIESSEPIADLFVDSKNKVILKPIEQGITRVVITAFDGFHYKEEAFELTIGKPLSVIDEVSNSFQMYPIPATNDLYISFSSIQAGTYVIRILDLTGKVIQEKSEENTSGSIQNKFEVSDILPGYYIIHVIKDETSILQRKIIKN